MKKLSPMLLIATGGTIDSYFDPSVDTMRPLPKSVLSEYLKSIKVDFPYRIVTVCMKDSRELTDKDRTKIVKEIQKSKAKHVLITHGTFTMTKTAEFLQKHGLGKRQCIVLTGSFIPQQQFSSIYSDAPFNIGYAIASAQAHTEGIYVAMHGKLFAPGKVSKNVSKSRFEDN